MEEITFDLQQVAEQIRHAMSCTEWKQTYGQTDERAGIWWVKDSGTYLMSNGINGAPRPEVAYAHDLGPDADWDLVQDDVFAMCDFAMQKDADEHDQSETETERLKSGTISHSAMKMKEVSKALVELDNIKT